MTFSVILSVHYKYWLRLLCAYMFFLYFLRYYSFIETYSIRYDKTLLYIFMFRCDNILILPALPAFEPNRIVLRFHLKYLYNSGSPPAGAGKTREFVPKYPRKAYHPRRCGENPSAICPFSRGSGSPPQVRGKLCGTSLDSVYLFITPAGAGKTFCGFDTRFLVEDHPRRCGENFPLRTRNRPETGSPPQVRGKLFYLNLLP